MESTSKETRLHLRTDIIGYGADLPNPGEPRARRINLNLYAEHLCDISFETSLRLYQPPAIVSTGLALYDVQCDYGIIEMQRGSEEGDVAGPDPPSHSMEMPSPFHDSSSFVNIFDLVRDLASTVDASVPKQATVQDIPPASSYVPSSRNDENDSLMRHAADYGEQYLNLRKANTSFLRRYNQFAPVRAEVLLLRSRMEFEWTVCSDQRRFVAESHDTFMREAASLCDAFATAPVMPHSPTKLLTALAQVVHDHQRQAEHASRTYDTETQLSRLEYSLQQKEYRVAQAAQRIVEILDQIGLPDPGASEPSVAASVVNQENVPALVQYYFDKAGDVGLAREHIIELEVEYREGREKRMFQEDQGILLSMSDEEFEETFKKQLLEAESGLADALRRVDNAKQVCIDSDLDVELYRNRLRRDPEGCSDRSVSDVEAFEAPGSSLPPVTPGTAHLSPSLAEAKRAFIQHPPHGECPSVIPDPIHFIARGPTPIQDFTSSPHADDNTASFPDRVKEWIDDVPFNAGELKQSPIDIPAVGNKPINTPDLQSVDIHPGAVQAASLSRSNSEVPSCPIVREPNADGTYSVNKAATHTRREERRQALRNHINGDESGPSGEARSYLHARTSSESQTMVIPWEGSYREAVDKVMELTLSSSD